MSYTHTKHYSTKNKYWNKSDIKMNGIIIHSVGCPQPKASVFANNFDSPNAAASIHGCIEPGTFIEMAPCFDKKGYAKKCCHVGAGSKGSYNDSRFGFEMTEPSTITYISGSQFKDKDPTATKKFIKDVTATAAEVCADVCIYHGISVSQIQTHAGAHAEGMGSGHGDPDHLWKYIGYTIADFRKDVQAQIDKKTKKEVSIMAVSEKTSKNSIVIYRTFDSIPAYAKPTIERLIKKNTLQGTGEKVNGKVCYDLTEDMLRTLVILDRNNKLF